MSDRLGAGDELSVSHTVYRHGRLSVYVHLHTRERRYVWEIHKVMKKKKKKKKKKKNGLEAHVSRR